MNHRLQRNPQSFVTIRQLMMLILAVATICALLPWNWGVAAFLGSVLLLLITKKTCNVFSRNRATTVAMWGVAVLTVYVLSCGPYLAFRQFLIGYGDAPWDNWPMRIVFAPQAYVLTHYPTPADHVPYRWLHDFLHSYTFKWRNLGWSAHFFWDALRGT